MKKHRKLLALLTVAVLLLSVLSGCNSEPEKIDIDDNQPIPSAPADVPATPSENQENPPEDVPEDTPEETPKTMYPLDESVTLSVWSAASPDMYTQIETLANHEIIKAAEQATNIHLTWKEVSIGDAAVQFGLMAASGDLCDIIKCFAMHYGSIGVTGAYNEELIVDLTPYLEDYAPDYYNIIRSDEATWRDATDTQGRALMFYNMRKNATIETGPVLRADLVDELGMDMPVTLDDYTKVLTAFKNEYGMTNAYFAGTGGDMMSNGFNTATEFYQIDNKIIYGPLQDEYYDYVKLVRSWYVDGIINSDFFNYSDNPMDSTVFAIKQSDDTGMFMASPSEINSFMTSQTTGRDDYSLVAVPMPMEKAGQVTHMVALPTVINTAQHTITVTTSCKDVESACLFANYWYTDEGSFLANYGIENVAYTYGPDGYPVFTDLVMNNPDGLPINVARQLYLFYTQIPNYQDARNLYGSYTENARNASDTWVSGTDGAYTLPATLTILDDYSAEYSAIMADISTLNDENWLAFVTGSKELNDENWQTYMDTIKTMKIDMAISYYQESLDEYLAK